MKLTLVLNSPPKFRYWKEFGAGRLRRMPHFKHWWNYWRNIIGKKPIADYTIPTDQLPPGSRLLNAEDFLEGHIDALPEELIRLKGQKTLHDHPWPFNVQLDPAKNQELMHNYTIDTRFFVPREDCQVLTNTLVESGQLEANPMFEPSDENINTIQRQYDWSTKDDSVLVKLPRKYEFPRINFIPGNKYGLTKERQETNILNSMSDYAQTLAAQYYHRQRDQEKLGEVLSRRSIAFPYCQVPFNRENRKLNLNLCIDSLLISNKQLPIIDSDPNQTRERQSVDIRPRSWKSLLERNRHYSPNWTFTLPRNGHIHTIQLASRIMRDHLNPDEMLARSILHAFGLGSQYARLRSYERQLAHKSDESKQASVVLQDPLSVSEVNDKDLLDQPIVLQTIGFDLTLQQFHFMRYQLNTVKFDDANGSRVKNQAWYSGPVSELGEALRFYLDFQAYNSSSRQKLAQIAADEEAIENKG